MNPSPMAAPTRFRAGEDRGARIGRMLRTVAGIEQVDEDLMRRIGERFWAVDQVGARLAAEVRARRVSLAQFRTALEHGLDAVPDAPPALAEFFAAVEATPSWFDPELADRGAAAYVRFGRNAGDVLLQLSLIGGYRFGGPTDLLVLTGGLAGDSTVRRLAETQQWTMAVTQPGGMRREAPGWKLTVHVRLMHALVNARFEQHPQWDRDRWGRPINQSDQAATLGLFTGALLLGVRALGVRVTREDSRAVMHLWRYVGWLMGVDEDWLFATEREQHRLNYHVLRAQDDVTEAGEMLARAIVDAQSRLHHRRFARFQRWYAPRRLLSMLRPFLGRRGLEDLGLPVRLPWATACVIAGNVLRYQLLDRTPWGRRRVEAWAARYREEQLYRYFGDDRPDVGALA